jgi:hypothetical protein
MAIRNNKEQNEQLDEEQKKLHYPELTPGLLGRLIHDRHIEAGKLPPDQHVFTLKGMSDIAKIFAMHIGRKTIASNGSPKTKHDNISRMFQRLLDESVNEYRRLKKTP